MGSLSSFFVKKRLLLLFLLLSGISLVLFFTKNAMQRTWLAAGVTTVNAWVNGYIDEGASYLRLKETNESLLRQNKALMLQLYGRGAEKNPSFKRVYDTLGGGQIFTIVDGDIVYNTINRQNNYFTINRGSRDGVEPGMGVIAPNGIGGIIINTTSSHALAQSILSVNKININASLKNSGFFGTLVWNGEDSRIMHLKDIPKYVPLAVGDTVVTDGKSAIFPQGIMIGRVAGYTVDNKTGYWDISVELNEKMGRLSKVYIVKNLKKAEVRQIQDSMQTAIEKND